MVEYNYDLFQNAKNDFNNAATSLSLLNPLVEKFQYCKVPKAVDTNIYRNIWISCGRLIACGEDLKRNFKYLENAIKDMGLAEKRYVEAMEELDAVNAEIWDFTTTPISGRPTIEEAEGMHQEITDLNERKRKLEEETAHLKDLLGIKTEEDKKWYESLEESMNDWYEDRKELADSYKNIFTNETSAGFISNVSNYFQTLSEVNKNVKSTNQQMQSNILRGTGNLLEEIGDFATQIMGWLASSAYKNPQSRMSPYLMYMQENGFADTQVKIIEETTKSIVTKDVVDNWYTSYYGTNKGKDINTYSYVKYDDEFAEAVNQATQSVGETAAIIALSTVGTPATGALLAASFEGSVKGGEAANYAYDNGATFDEATLYSALVGGANAGATYLGSTYFSNIFGNAKNMIPTKNVIEALKMAYKNPESFARIMYQFAAGTSVPLIETSAEWLTWGSDYKTFEDFLNIASKNKTSEKAILAGVLSLGLGTVGEVAGSIAGYNKVRKDFLNNFGKYGMDESKIDDALSKIVLADDSNFELLYKKYFPEDEWGSIPTTNGFNSSKSGGPIVIKNNGNKSIDEVIKTYYHELEHSVGGVYRGPLHFIKNPINNPFDPNFKATGVGLDEAITDLLAQRHSGKPSNSYNQEAIKLLDTLENKIDPKLTYLIEEYSSRLTNIDSLYMGIYDYLSSKGLSAADKYQIGRDLSDQLYQGFSIAMNIEKGVTKMEQDYGISVIQAAIDTLSMY